MGKKMRFLLLVITVSLITFGAGCSDGNQARVQELEQELAALRTEKETLRGQVTALQAEVAGLREGEEIGRAPKDGWEQYFPGAAETTLKGESTAKVQELLGNPPYLIRSIAVNTEFSREIWIFSPYEEDPTGLYLFFKGGKLYSSILNEFAGLPGSNLLDLTDFWTQ